MLTHTYICAVYQAGFQASYVCPHLFITSQQSSGFLFPIFQKKTPLNHEILYLESTLLTATTGGEKKKDEKLIFIFNTKTNNK